MDHVATILLGTELEQQIENTKTIVARGFPDGTIAICWECNKVRKFTVRGTARRIALGRWPRCCGNKKMEMDAPGNEPRF